MGNMDKEIIKQMRKDIFITGYKGGMAHLASCYSCLEILYVLYMKKIMSYRTDNPKWQDRDRLILSKGHAGLALFRVMAEVGLLSMDTFGLYLKDGSDIGGEPCMRDVSGIEATTGSLGHGLSIGVGIALANKMDGTSAHVYVILGDGELGEGSVWEAAMSAAQFKMDNLTAILDCNGIQKMDTTENVMGISDWRNRWSSFGWAIKEVDGHDVERLQTVLSEPFVTNKPKLIIAHTVKGKGVSIMENNPNWHFKLPESKKEMRCFMQELGVKEEELGI